MGFISVMLGLAWPLGHEGGGGGGRYWRCGGDICGGWIGGPLGACYCVWGGWVGLWGFAVVLVGAMGLCWPGGGALRAGAHVGCVQSREFGVRPPHLPNFILLVRFSDTLLVVSILGSFDNFLLHMQNYTLEFYTCLRKQ